MKLKFLFFILISSVAVTGRAQTLMRVQGPQLSAVSYDPTNSFVARVQSTKVFSISGHNTGPDQWIFCFATNAVPANGNRPYCAPVKVPSGSNFSIDYPDGKNFTNGVVVCNSTSGTTFTKGAADVWYDLNFWKDSY